MNRASYKLEERTLYVNLGPEIDHHHVTIINKELSNYLQLYMIKNIVFDFKNVTFMDSAGIGLVMGGYKQTVTFGGSTTLCNVSERVDRIFAMSGVYRFVGKVEI